MHFLVTLAAGDLFELLGRERVEADVEPPQAGVPERLGLLGQQDAVGRQADVFDARHGSDLGDQLVDVAADERLAPGQANLVDAQVDNDPHEAFDLLESEQLAAVHELGVVGRHAIEAADIAAIGHADPQVRVHAAEAVDERSAADGASIDGDGPGL